MASGTGEALSAELGATGAEEDEDEDAGAGAGDVAFGAPIPNSKAGLDSSLSYKKFSSFFLMISLAVGYFGRSVSSLIMSLSSPKSGPSLS